MLEASYKVLLASLPILKYVFPVNRLPRNSNEITNVSDDNSDKKEFRRAQSAELAFIIAMGT